MKERPIFYKKPIKTEKDFSTSVPSLMKGVIPMVLGWDST